jgi:carboxylesterase type B
MLHNDLSNKTSPILAFNVDNLLFKKDRQKKSSGLRSAVLRFLSEDKVAYDYFDRNINMSFVYAINGIFTGYNFGIYLITTMLNSQEQLDSLTDLLYEVDMYYTRLKNITVDELRREVEYRYMYYFDNDDSMLSQVGKSNAIHIKDISLYIKNHEGRKPR